MDHLARFLQALGYHAVTIQPMLSTNLHLIVSALLPIYTGAHASLSRPCSAAKPPKRSKSEDDGDDSDQDEQKMEGMSPADAIILPLLAGCTLACLYVLIKWLDDLIIFNKVLGWYFSLFGIFALARLITDVMGTITSLAFPSMYTSGKQTWIVDGLQRKAIAGSVERLSPLPGPFAIIPLPASLLTLIWIVRELSYQKLQFRARVRKIVHINAKIGLQGCLAFLFAVAIQVYYNVVAKPWWMTNTLGISVAYSALQLISPSTASTGTLILCALFVYDIYFVFFTPLMVTVATSIDIPAKLLFPRPSGPHEDPTKQAMSMLGLGDVVLPGMFMGFALRFDLYLFYLGKQKPRRKTEDAKPDAELLAKTSSKLKDQGAPTQKATYLLATGGWGERFWNSRNALASSPRYQGLLFPKTYFHATLIGYVIGMLFTLGVMQVSGHAQPALLYLVPGVLGAFWGTALMKGDLKELWAFSEASDDEERQKEKGKSKEGSFSGGEKGGSVWSWRSWQSIFFTSKTTKEKDGQNGEHNDEKSTSDVPKNSEPETSDPSTNHTPNSSSSNPKPESTEDTQAQKSNQHHRHHHPNDIIFLSISWIKAPSKPSEIKS